jgi:2-succinyl-6-hydroxy-2,4-cyclohexadiene-1-carboxylate synthase
MTLPSYSLSYSPKGPALLFLHGFLGCRYDWDEQIEMIGGRYRCLRVDLPGHHYSCQNLPREEYAMPRTAALIVRLLDQCRIDRCGLVGYSMGGRLGLYLLTHFADRFGAALIESASPGLRTYEERGARRQDDARLAGRLREEPFDMFVRDWYAQPLFKTIDQGSPRFAAMLERRADHDPSALAQSLQGMGTGAMPPLWSDLPGLDIPVLFVAGEKDEKYRRLADEMANLCPRGQAAIIPDTGHNVHFERPEAYSHALLDLFDANQ